MGSRTVLVVDDDETTRDVVRRYLARAGFTVVEAADGVSALTVFGDTRPDLVVLDLMLPGMDGLDVCERLRSRSQVPIMMLTALGSESDRVVGLEQGADDYVVKPFSPREVTLRVQRLLERSRPVETGDRVLTDGDLVVEPLARRATLAGVPLSLTGREFDLLAFLLAHPEVVFSRTDLLERVWDWSFGDDSTVTVHVRRLREKIEADPSSPARLQTVWGAGYRYHPGTGQQGER